MIASSQRSSSASDDGGIEASGMSAGGRELRSAPALETFDGFGQDEAENVLREEGVDRANIAGWLQALETVGAAEAEAELARGVSGSYCFRSSSKDDVVAVICIRRGDGKNSLNYRLLRAADGAGIVVEGETFKGRQFPDVYAAALAVSPAGARCLPPPSHDA